MYCSAAAVSCLLPLNSPLESSYFSPPLISLCFRPPLVQFISENEYIQLCDLGEVESESHLLLYCTHYDDLRILLFEMKCLIQILEHSGGETKKKYEMVV